MGNSIVLQNNNKKTNFNVVVTDPIRNEKTKEWQQSQTVIVPDTQKADGDQQSNGKETNNFLFYRQDAIRTNQINTITHPKVINLPSTCLTYMQVRVLSKGLKFTPTPRRNTIEMEKDIHNFMCKLRLTVYFAKLYKSKII